MEGKTEDLFECEACEARYKLIYEPECGTPDTCPFCGSTTKVVDENADEDYEEQEEDEEEEN